MSLVHKIPPMVSALAFGYGVGMAAPQSAITSVQSAVATYQLGGARAVAPGGSASLAAPAPAASYAPRAPGGAPVAPYAPAAPGPSGLAPAGALSGSESRELARLRDAAAREAREGAACDLERPSYSRPPRAFSAEGGYADDVDDLDAAGVEALSRLQLPDLRLSVSRRTLKYVRFFTRTDRGRNMFETWLKRSGRYQELIQTELRERRLPEDLIWVAMIESGFDPRARSPAGAVGLWQFMPATGAVYGLQQTRHLDQRKNPRLATQAAAHHLRDLYMRFGHWDLALAAYNMGYEQLLDRIDRYGTSDFNELARQQALPSETAAYVPKIGAAAIVANNLERFGFEDVKVSRPIDAAEIPAPPGTPLKTLAKAAGVATSTLRKLNPDLLGDRVPPGRGDYLVMIPADTLARAQAALPAMLDMDSLATDDASILDPVDLLGGRDFTERRALRRDESLLALLPKPKKRRTMREPVAALAADGDGDEGPEADEGDAPARRRTARARSSKRAVMYYRVSPGDTLIGVARQFAIDVEDVASDNGLEPDQKLRAGALLKLRVRPDVVDRAAAAAPSEAKDTAASAEEAKGDRARDAAAPARPAAGQRGEARQQAKARGAAGEARGAAPEAAEKKRDQRG
ncbi:Slt family transglycosylase [Sorangium cellulosum]|uniref:Slt family transglycosylase n=2 Tax=Sorangium cellulosum TaxID=56 RepID=A0A4P2Q449_SORCE|nr:Slt family transglycosylase [Sorangium cellulosum]